MSEQYYGDAPIEEEYKEKMTAIAGALDEVLNGSDEGPARKTGFVLLVFPYGEGEGRCNYIFNGASRKDVIKLLREQANRFEVSERSKM